jgi:putative ABC transport system permease protein
MVINRAADDGNLKVGDTATVLTPAPVQAEIVGIVRLGDDDSTGGATFAGFTLTEAQRLFMPAPDDLSSLYLAAEPGVSQEQLVANVRTALPDGVEAITGHTLTEEDKQALDAGFLDFFDSDNSQAIDLLDLQQFRLRNGTHFFP